MDDKLLNRVRGLLAKAESSEFPNEAQSLREKAESLIVLHGIEQAMLTPAEQDPIIETVIKFEGAFTKQKRYLLGKITDGLKIVCVGHRPTDERGYRIRNAQGYASATVIGPKSVLEQVEFLYTSLLLQGTREMGMVTSGWHGRSGAAETRAMRSSFLMGFAERAGERLEAIYAKGVREATDSNPGKALVFVSRKSLIDARVKELFGRLVYPKNTVSRSDSYYDGRNAAERADIGQSRMGSRKSLPTGS